MIFGDDRDELRRMYRDAWEKRVAGAPLTPLEAQIADVVETHPEYRNALGGEALDRDYAPDDGETNPFLHMGLHLALREQVATDRPAGIAAVFRRVSERLGDQHAAEHRLIEALAETLWEAQSRNEAPDERAYLERLRRL